MKRHSPVRHRHEHEAVHRVDFVKNQLCLLREKGEEPDIVIVHSRNSQSSYQRYRTEYTVVRPGGTVKCTYHQVLYVRVRVLLLLVPVVSFLSSRFISTEQPVCTLTTTTKSNPAKQRTKTKTKTTTTTMSSDLLPLVAAVLQDRVAADAQKEIASLQRKLKGLQTIRIVHYGYYRNKATSSASASASANNNNGNADEEGEGVANAETTNHDDDDDDADLVYASGVFEDGQYGDNPTHYKYNYGDEPNLWNITLKPGTQTQSQCPLRDLRHCTVDMGGGLPILSLNDRGNAMTYEGFLDSADWGKSHGDGNCEIQFCVDPHSTWLTVEIHGWPREEWDPMIQTWNIDSAIEYLVETVAVDHPTATVQFKRVSFDIREMHGPLKRHLPPRPTVVRDKVTEFLKEIGHSQDNEYWFEKGVNRVSNLLEDIGMDELTDDEGVRKIREVVGIYHRLGDNGVRDALRSEIDNRQSLLLQRRQSSGSKRKLDEN